MQLSNDRQVNEKSFEIGMNSQNFARFDPLSWEKIENIQQNAKLVVLVAGQIPVGSIGDGSADIAGSIPYDALPSSVNPPEG